MRTLPFSKRILALAGAALTLTLGLIVVLVLRGSSSAPPLKINYHPTVAHHEAAASPARRSAHSARRAIRTHAAVHLNQGLPKPLRRALETHSLVVAVVASPDETVDATTIVSAADGARKVGAGFALLDVRNRATASAVAAFAQNAGDPTILIVRRPGTIAGQFSGYEDATTIAQAVLDLR